MPSRAPPIRSLGPSSYPSFSHAIAPHEPLPSTAAVYISSLGLQASASATSIPSYGTTLPQVEGAGRFWLRAPKVAPPAAEGGCCSLLKGSMRWKGCIILDYYRVGDSQPYMLAVRLPTFHVRRLLSLSTSKPKIASCRRMTADPCLGSQHSHSRSCAFASRCLGIRASINGLSQSIGQAGLAPALSAALSCLIKRRMAINQES
jgi:hypothetical protein